MFYINLLNASERIYKSHDNSESKQPVEASDKAQ